MAMFTITTIPTTTGREVCRLRRILSRKPREHMPESVLYSSLPLNAEQTAAYQDLSAPVNSFIRLSIAGCVGGL